VCAIAALLSLSTPTYADTAIGVLLASHHFDSGYNYNESHAGVYIRHNNWSIGTFTNSYNDQSTFVGYRAVEGTHFDLSFAVANGYDHPDAGGWDDEYQFTVALTYKLWVTRTSVTPALVLFGLEAQLTR